MRISDWSSDVCSSDLVPDWNPRSFEVGPQPALGLVEADAAPHRIILDLILTDPRDAEIFGLRMADIETRHRRGGHHRKMVGQLDPGRRLGTHPVEQRSEERRVGKE